MKNILFLALLLASTQGFGQSLDEKLLSLIDKSCPVKTTGFVEVIPAPEDRYERARDLPDKHMRFSCQNGIEVRYFQKDGIVSVEVVQFLKGKPMKELSSIMGTEEGVKTRELKKVYGKLKDLRAKILKKKN